MPPAPTLAVGVSARRGGWAPTALCQHVLPINLVLVAPRFAPVKRIILRDAIRGQASVNAKQAGQERLVLERVLSTDMERNVLSAVTARMGPFVIL